MNIQLVFKPAAKPKPPRTFTPSADSSLCWESRTVGWQHHAWKGGTCSRCEAKLPLVNITTL